MCLVSGCVFVWIEHGSATGLKPGGAVGVYRGWADPGGVSPFTTAQNKKGGSAQLPRPNPNPSKSKGLSVRETPDAS